MSDVPTLKRAVKLMNMSIIKYELINNIDQANTIQLTNHLNIKLDNA